MGADLAPTQASPAKQYGLLECQNAKLLAAVGRSQAGILRCTVNDQTHCPDAGRKWGSDTWLNDLYFGMQGGLFVGGDDQHRIFRRELRKIGRHVSAGPGRPPVPFSVSADGSTPSFNHDPGMDLDRCAQFILEIARIYEVTGDRQIVVDLYPQCREVLNFLSARDLDDDLLPEGRSTAFTDPPGKGVGACSSLSYIGDSVANTWKDFGLALFYYEALRHLAFLENLLGKKDAAKSRLQAADKVKRAVRSILWNEKTDGFLAWVEKDGIAHDDWITGNNLHAVMCGLASHKQAIAIMRNLDAHRAEIEEIIPGRVRIGLFAEGLCSNRANYYWNGGIWPLVSGPDMIARAGMDDLSGAYRVAELLSTRPKYTEHGFYEAYDGKTGEPNDCPGLLMNNGGFLWGFFEGVLGIRIHGDLLSFRDRIPQQLLPAMARIRYRGADIEIRWKAGESPLASLDGRAIAPANGHYSISLSPKPEQLFTLDLVVPRIS